MKIDEDIRNQVEQIIAEKISNVFIYGSLGLLIFGIGLALGCRL